jgi:hypothetical protein
MAIKTQGTNLYAIDPTDDSLIAVGCVTSISGVTASRDQIEITCLEDQARSYESGMLAPGAASFSLNFDPSDTTHVRLHQIYASGDTIHWAIGWSDGTAVPVIDSNGEFDPPTSRSWLVFDGYISELPFEFAVSAVVTSSLSVQISGFPTMIPKV